jgi:hypothetical protein
MMLGDRHRKNPPIALANRVAKMFQISLYSDAISLGVAARLTLALGVTPRLALGVPLREDDFRRLYAGWSSNLQPEKPIESSSNTPLREPSMSQYSPILNPPGGIFPARSIGFATCD